jgi:Calcineurin-like phosphoesterase
MRMTWISDIHLDYLTPQHKSEYLQSLATCETDAFLIGGDMGESDSFPGFLAEIENAAQKPLYFVLGNHDYYKSSIEKARQLASQFGSGSRYSVYLPDAGLIELTESTGLVGIDGWVDGRLGDFMRSPVRLRDYNEITDFLGLEKGGLLNQLNRLGDEMAAHCCDLLPRAFESCGHIYLLTHIPPYRETCRHKGIIGNDDWLPHFTCKALGDALLEIMREHPENSLTVLAGHTHCHADFQPLPNLRVRVADALDGAPAIADTFEVKWGFLSKEFL